MSHRRGRRLVVGVLTCSVVLTGLAFAGQPEPNGRFGGGVINPAGEPKQFAQGMNAMYAVWHNKNGWHFRMTTAKKERRFSGLISVKDGEFVKVTSHNLELVGPKNDRWLVSPDNRALKFDFRTDKGVDGIN